MNAQEIASTLQQIHARLVELAGHSRIYRAYHGFGDNRLGYFLPDDVGNPVPGRWCTVFSERGENELRATLDSEEDLLWLLYQSMLQSAAIGWEVARRIPHQDSRRAWFAKMAEWTAAYWPQWSARLEAHHEAILVVAPFDDDNVVFVEFVLTLPPTERHALRSLSGHAADRVRAAVIDLFRTTGSLPTIDQVERVGGVSLRA